MLSILTSILSFASVLSLSVGVTGCGNEHPAKATGSAAVAVTEAAQNQAGAVAAKDDFPYLLGQPTAVYPLPEALTEVSGIRFLNGKDPHIYAEQDEKGRLYWLVPGDKTANYYDFGKNGDYEDLVFLDGKAIFLRSDGDLFSFDVQPALTAAHKAAVKLTHTTDLVPKGEYEGLYADTVHSRLYMLCKDCAHEDHKKTVAIHRLDVREGHWVKAASYQVDVAKISELLNLETQQQSAKKKKHSGRKISFKPSAICKNPTTGEWYLLSSINKVLVVTNSDWQVKSVHSLPAKLYPQPEGLCFDQAGNLFISNEGQTPGGATLLKFTPSF